jgi:hypothetical protein
MNLLHDLWLLVRSYPIAKRIVRGLNSDEYPGCVKAAIAYQKVRTALVAEAKYTEKEITGSVVYIAISLAAYKHAS